MLRRIIALDPGGTTGWATFTFLEMPGGEETYDEVFQCGQLYGEHHDELDTLLGMQHVESYTIVCESFQKYRDLNSAELISLEYIGVVKRFAQERVLPIQFQSSSEGKLRVNGSFVNRSHLVRLGLWSSGQRHAMDAYSHLLYYMLHTADRVPLHLRLKYLEAWK